MYSVFPPPPKPPKKNYIKENIKHLQSLQTHHKLDSANVNTIKKKLNPISRPVPKQKTENQETKPSNHLGAAIKIDSQVRIGPIRQTSVQDVINFNATAKKKPIFHSRTNIRLPSISTTISSNQRTLSIAKSPKKRDAGCQYLESDSRYYFADGSTVHFVYPSENRKSIFVKPMTSVRKLERKNSVYLRTTESYRRKQSNRLSMMNKRNSKSEEQSRNRKDAVCQYNELDFINVITDNLPEEKSCLKNIPETNSELEPIEIPKLNLKEPSLDLHQGDGSMASVIEAGRISKALESQRSMTESSVSIPIFKDDKSHSTTDASVVTLVDLHQESEDAKNTEKPLSNEELVKKLKNQFSKRVDELNHMPMRSDTLRARTRKIQLERELMELEKNIKHLSYPKARLDIRAIS